MKKLAFIAVCAMLAFSGCTQNAADGENIENTENTENGTETGDDQTGLDAEEIREYMPVNDKFRLYHGYAEAGFEIHFLRTEDDGLVYVYEGAMNDERGAEDGPRTFEVTYSIEDGAVVESVENHDYMAESETTLYSKIEDMIVLQGPIEEGNSWEQAVEIDGNPTVLETTITEVTDEGFSTVSMAEAEGYRDGKYTEERTYTKGIGLTSFSNTPYGSDKDDLLIFGYGYTVENDESITGME